MEQEGRPVARRERLWAFFELFALVGFVVAQPTLDVLGKAPDFFIFRRAGRAEILILVLAVTLLPALGLWLAEQAAGLAGERARRTVHLLMVGGLLAVLALEVGKNLTSVRGPGLVAIGVAGGVAGGLLYANWDAFKLWLRYLAPAPLASPCCSCSSRRCPSWCCPSRTAPSTPTRPACASTRSTRW